MDLYATKVGQNYKEGYSKEAAIKLALITLRSHWLVEVIRYRKDDRPTDGMIEARFWKDRAPKATEIFVRLPNQSRQPSVEDYLRTIFPDSNFAMPLLEPTMG